MPCWLRAGKRCFWGYFGRSHKPAGEVPRAASTALRRLQPRPWDPSSSHTPPSPFPSPSAPKPSPDTRGGFTWLLPPPLGPQQREVALGPQPAAQQGQQDAARQRQPQRAAPRHGRRRPPLRPPLYRGSDAAGAAPAARSQRLPHGSAAPASSRLPFHPFSPAGRGGQLRSAPLPEAAGAGG